jgi:lipoprotein NlpD
VRAAISLLLILLLCLALLGGCSTHSTYAPVRDRTHAPQSTAGVHVVRPGETLFSIAWQYGLDYQTVAAWNRIRPPYTIYPGQRINLRGPTAQPSVPPPPSKAPATARPATGATTRCQPGPVQPTATILPAHRHGGPALAVAG